VLAVLSIDLAKCTGCRRCEASCAFVHTGRVSPRLARIRVLNIYEIGVDAPVVCAQCAERYCLKCPEEALSLGEHGQVVFSPTLCNHCGACEQSCPIGAIEIFNDIVHVCDLCGGDPKCIGACSEDAISWLRDEQESVSLEAVRAASKKLNPSERRLARALQQSEGLRREWIRA
jgi:Fe-S-cluster-containing hydrogenase component 2